MTKLFLKSPAKINLTLNIINKRHDGYHNLNTIMQTISLFDDIIIKKSDKFKCCCNLKNLSNTNLNLAAIAAKEFFKTTSISQTVNIKIFKRIPIKAGLGGGSSNAAYVLKGLNKMFKTNLNQKELSNIAKNIGSDVSFFIYGHTAQATSTGYKLKQLQPLPNCYILILKPKYYNILTKSAFAKFDEISKKSKLFKINKIETDEIITRINNNEPLQHYCDKFFNDFETVLNLKVITKLKLKLKKLGAKAALMSGSGPSVFAIFNNISLAKKAFATFSKEKFYKFLVKPI